MKPTTFIGLLMGAFGTGMSLTGGAAAFGAPIALAGLMLTVAGEYRIGVGWRWKHTQP